MREPSVEELIVALVTAPKQADMDTESAKYLQGAGSEGARLLQGPESEVALALRRAGMSVEDLKELFSRVDNLLEPADESSRERVHLVLDRLHGYCASEWWIE